LIVHDHDHGHDDHDHGHDDKDHMMNLDMDHQAPQTR
jgi:hypothetical protein